MVFEIFDVAGYFPDSRDPSRKTSAAIPNQVLPRFI
jgi:hypothetical protein